MTRSSTDETKARLAELWKQMRAIDEQVAVLRTSRKALHDEARSLEGVIPLTNAAATPPEGGPNDRP